MDKFVLFDVGANWGTDSLERTQSDQNIETWAFEPVPELIANLTTKSAEYADRYHIVPSAVSNFDGTAQFNIADHYDWGCSSLNNFSDNLGETWPGRLDFKFNRSITVQVTRLDTWFRSNNFQIEKIDYFHCDTQGSDLKVLQGMGDYISLIQAGVVECARDEGVKLYKENHTKVEMIEFLNSKGFEVIREQGNDSWNKEINLYFKKI
jgi:FkbM family methyltransferase